MKKLRYSTGESYQISENNGYLVGEIESDKNGIVTLPSLPYGRYVVVETTTPKDKYAHDHSFSASLQMMNMAW